MEIEETENIDLTPTQEEFVDNETSCCLCGTELTFHHEVDWLTQKVKEKAQCPSCGVQTKEKEHQLH